MRRTPCGNIIDLTMQIQEEHGMPSIKHYEIPFPRRCIAVCHSPIFDIKPQGRIASQVTIHYEIPFVRSEECAVLFLYIICQENAIMRSRLMAVLYCPNMQNTETSNMFLNKHYEIPFVKECVARFPLLYIHETATVYITSQVNAFA